MRLRYFLLSGFTALLAACSDSSGSSPAPAVGATGNFIPSLQVQEPAAPVVVTRGAPVTVRYTASDIDDVAVTRVYLDGDGDLITTGDRFAVADPQLENDGAVQEVTGYFVGVPAGVYRVVAEIDDGENPVVTVIGPGTVELRSVAWVNTSQKAGTNSRLAVTSTAVAPDGSSYIAGQVKGTALIGYQTPEQITLRSVGTEDLFIARFRPDGSLDWARTEGEVGGTSEAVDVEVLSDGSCVVVAGFLDAVVLGRGQGAQVSYTQGVGGGPNRSFVMARYDTSGNLLWSRGGGDSSAGSFVSAVAVGSNDDLFVSGLFRDSLRFGAGEPTEQTLQSLGGVSDVQTYIARFSPSGGFVWARTDWSTGEFFMTDMRVRGASECLLAGYFKGTSTFGQGEAGETIFPSGFLGTTTTQARNTFLASYRPDGTLAWAKRITGDGEIPGARVAVFPDGSCVLGGGYSGTAELADGGGQPLFLQADTSGKAMFLARFGADGSLQWAKKALNGASIAVADLTVLPDGSFVAGGSHGFSATLFSGPGATSAAAPGGVSIGMSAPNTRGGYMFTQWEGDGSMRWAVPLGEQTTGELSIQRLIGRPDGSFFAAGIVTDTYTLGAGGPDEITIGQQFLAGGASYLARFNADGLF